MDGMDSSLEILSMASLILVFLLHSHRTLALPETSMEEDDYSNDLQIPQPWLDCGSLDANAVCKATLHHWRLWTNLTVLDEDLGFWVKPRSTTWFSKFLLEEYDDERWIRMFRMTKRSVLSLAALLTPAIRRRDTNYRQAVPVTVRLGCALFKLCQGASLLICSELFAVGQSTVSILLCDVVNAINVVLRKEISWSTGERITSIANDFQQLCGLPGVLGAIDGTHFAISKPRFEPADYYYFKSGGYTIQCQAVVDSCKRFLDLHVGMPGSTDDSRVLRRSTLFHRGQRNNLWQGRPTFHGYSPFLLGDAGFPLLSWLMVPHRQQGNLSVADQLFNRKLSKGRAVVENAFAFFKLTFRELHRKSDLDITFFPDVVTACCILHNVLLQQSHNEVEGLLEILRTEGLQENVDNFPNTVAQVSETIDELVDEETSQEKRSQLGVFLTLQRIVPF